MDRLVLALDKSIRWIDKILVVRRIFSWAQRLPTIRVVDEFLEARPLLRLDKVLIRWFWYPRPPAGKTASTLETVMVFLGLLFAMPFLVLQALVFLGLGMMKNKPGGH